MIMVYWSPKKTCFTSPTQNNQEGLKMDGKFCNYTQDTQLFHWDPINSRLRKSSAAQNITRKYVSWRVVGLEIKPNLVLVPVQTCSGAQPENVTPEL